MAGFLTEVCHNVGIEPPLQPLTGKHLTLRSANKEDGACLDIVADNFWGRDHVIYDIRGCAMAVRGFVPLDDHKW